MVSTGSETLQVLDGPSQHVPMVFNDKQIVAYSIEDAYLLEEDHVHIVHTNCEIYFPIGLLSKVCHGNADNGSIYDEFSGSNKLYLYAGKCTVH